MNLRLETLEDRWVPNNTPHSLAGGNFSQNWGTMAGTAAASLITVDDDWSGVPSINGFRGDGLSSSSGTNPQTIVADGSATPSDVNANRDDPNTFLTGGIAEFDAISNPVVAFQGSGTADAPHLVIYLNATGRENVSVSYNLRDIDGSSDNSMQPVAIQYRVSGTGTYTDVSAGFTADASSGPNLASQVRTVNVTLPAAVNNQALVEVRIITSDAAGLDEWVGIDDIVVASTAIPVVNAVPVITSNGGGTMGSASVAENTTAVTTVAATDADLPGQTLMYSLVPGADAGKFMINPSTGILTFASAPDFENPTDADTNNVYNVTVQVSDGNGGTDTQILAVTVTDVAAGTPSVTNATTDEDSRSVTGLVITGNATGDVTTHYKITGITNGTLFLADGTTTVAEGSFITFAQANAGLKFTPASNLNSPGSIFTFKVQASTTDSNVGLGGSQVTATITVNAVNDAPAGADQAVTAEEDVDYVFRAADFALTDANDSPAHLLAAVTITSVPGLGALTNNGTVLGAGASVPLADITGGLFKYRGALNGNGIAYTTFTFQVRDGGGTAFGGVDLDPSPDTMTVNVTPVNDEPTFTASSPPTIDEDDPAQVVAFVSAFSPGPGDEGGQGVLTYTVSNVSNPSLFSVLPSVAANGTLSYTPAANAFGTSTFDVQVRDNGGTAGTGADDTSSVQTFTITVNPVNDAPTFAASAPPTIDEDAGAQAVSGFVSSFTPGPANESDQTLSSYAVTVMGIAGNLAFTAAPAIDPTTGALTYEVAPNTNGTAVISVTVTDSGSGAAPNVNTSAPQTFTITVRAVNDAPTFTVTNPPAVSQGAGAQAVPGFATFAAGPPTATDELGQSAASYNVSPVGTTGTLTFTSAPSIDASGNLTYTATPGTSGAATFDVVVFDSGSGVSPNVNVSAARAFTITVTAPTVVPTTATPVDAGTPGSPVAAPAPVVVPKRIAVGTDAGAPGVVRLLDAATRAPLLPELTPFEGYAGGITVACGDVTGDGNDDLIVSTATGIGHVKVFDGATGVELRSFLPFGAYPSGLSVAAGDVDGDGFADLVVGIASGPAHVMVFSGRTGAVLRSFIAFEGFLGGVTVAAGDVDVDGFTDIAVVAGPGGGGHIKVFDGASLSPRQSYLAYQGYLGEINLAVGDLDGDGVGEIITTALNPAAGAHVRAVTAGGAEVASFFVFAPAVSAAPATTGQTFLREPVAGGVVPAAVALTTTPARVAATDVTGDGIADILLGSAPGAASELLVVDGRTLQRIDLRFAFDAQYALGVYVG